MLARLPGDVLILTKPLGTGSDFHGTEKRQGGPGISGRGNGLDDPAEPRECGSAAPIRRRINEAHPVHAVTDVTGFGLLGHAREMAIGSGVSMTLNHATVAYLPGAVEAARERNFSGGLANNREFLRGMRGIRAQRSRGIPGTFLRSADLRRITGGDCTGMWSMRRCERLKSARFRLG